MLDVAVSYQAIPHNPWAPGREIVVSKIIREIARFETLFSDYQKACNPICDDVGRCEQCRERLLTIARALSDPKARVWEVWRVGEEPEVVGILYLTDIKSGMDAKSHFVFFDGELRTKSDLIESMIQWCFSDHDDWKALDRLTVEVPVNAFALARHAVRKLGFGGDFRYKMPGRKHFDLPVEGVRRGAIRKDGRRMDVLLLGRQNG